MNATPLKIKWLQNTLPVSIENQVVVFPVERFQYFLAFVPCETNIVYGSTMEHTQAIVFVMHGIQISYELL